jgi:hypothetical protein
VRTGDEPAGNARRPGALRVELRPDFVIAGLGAECVPLLLIRSRILRQPLDDQTAVFRVVGDFVRQIKVFHQPQQIVLQRTIQIGPALLHMFPGKDAIDDVLVDQNLTDPLCHPRGFQKYRVGEQLIFLEIQNLAELMQLLGQHRPARFLKPWLPSSRP